MCKVCGLDIHKDTIFMAVLSTNGKVQLKEFSTLIPDIEVLRNLLMKEGVKQVAIESTGIYWVPVWRLLEKHVHGRIRNKHKVKVTESLNGTISKTDVLLLRQSYQQLRLIEDQQAELVKEMEAICDSYYKNEVSLLCTIPGVQKLSAMRNLREIKNLVIKKIEI